MIRHQHIVLLGYCPPSVLEVKGLRHGMTVEEAARVMQGHGFEVGDGRQPCPEEAELKLDSGRLVGDDWKFDADDACTVERVELWPQVLSKLFHAGDMTSEELATSFANANGVPLEPTLRGMGADMAAILT